MNKFQKCFIFILNLFSRKYKRLPINSSEWISAFRYISNLKLNYDLNCTECNKILYTMYGVFLVSNGIKICESPRCWTFGPVFPNGQNEWLKPKLNREETYIKINVRISIYFRTYRKIYNSNL